MNLKKIEIFNLYYYCYYTGKQLKDNRLYRV